MSNKSSNTIEKEFENLRKELLDLTLRNQLLNFKSRAKTITIVNQSPINIYQTLVLQENKMYFVANKKDKKEDKSSVWDHIPFDLSKFSEGDKKLATDLTPKELQKRLYYINNQAKTMLQEQGYNILYLAVGFLEWKDKSKPRQVNKAPLVLIPVSMERKKVGESFNLEWTGEDIQTNISLKAKLLEAGIELPDFEFKKYGEVIDHYIAKVRNATARMDGWNVNNDIAIGFFSFTKFVMYNDLNPEAWEENVDLTKNELIQAIFNPAKNDQEAFKEEDIDSQLEYQNMYQVLDADSSQIAAIQDVKAGRNLVVEGPPGTGKSQTIVNLISELLAEGKSVLFVSEKMAALDVVKDRLTNVGLGKFVLELHSHKTRRKKFLKDLEKATNVRPQNDLDVDQTIRKLETLRRQLDDYAQIIHKPAFAVNLSPFQLYGMKESADDHFARKNQIIPLVRFSNPENISLKDLDDLTLALENLAELYQTISKENPWSKCSPKSLLPADLREIEILINDTLHALDNFLVERGRVYDIYGIKKPDTLNEFENSLSAFEIIKSKNAELIDGSILKSGAWEGNNDDAFRLIQELERYQKYSHLLDKFNDSIFQVNIDQLIYQLQDLSNKKFRFFNNKQHIELVERYYSVPVTGNVDEIIHDLAEAKAVIKIKNKLDANENLGKKYFGNYWYLGADTNDLKAIANWMNEFTILVNSGTFSQNTIDLLSKDLYDINPERDLAEYIESGEDFVRVLSKLKDKLNPRSKLIFKRETGDVPFEAWQEQLYAWRGQLSSLHLWSQYLNTKNAIEGSEAAEFIDAIEKRNIKKDDIEALVQGNFADSLLNILFVQNEELATFIGELHENRIKEFEDLDKKIMELNRKRIYNKLNSNIPKIFGGTEDPQAKILAGEFTRKSGHMPVRKLLEKAGGMIKQIKPCFMMSPLSVAQYLDPTNEQLQFDVVIFDEASQVKPEDALGAFMRGKTAVVMGDTQQLPPTSFFDQMSDADSDEEEATSLDMESILHLCKLSFPVKMLKWHYRSRHESLISVSNKEFYDNELLVYPSPSHNDPELGLKFHYNPNTAYERGGSSKNPLEAKDVVDEIFNHFDKYGDTKSLGVGTFSVAQKNAILEELEVRRKERPELEPLFSESKDERFFVKNLETIQGDERDVILISVGYGFDTDRKMSLNFGPLNQDGGERRLNVLITRAREKCVVFSNFKAYDMQLTANPPYGVKSLKEFLEYAENLTLGTQGSDFQTKEPFEDAICSFLEENGYQVDKQIGCAGFRVDLAIVDEENPGKYILGITTDGKMYASSKVARDRDRLREQVLTGLGWKLYHLWSTDWYRNRDLGRKKLLDFVEKTIKETREEERRKSEEAKKLAEQRRIEAEKKAEELRLAREKEEAEKAAAEEEDEKINPEDIGPSDFVEVEKIDEEEVKHNDVASDSVDEKTDKTDNKNLSSDKSEIVEPEDEILEKPVDVGAINPSEFFEDEDLELDVEIPENPLSDDSAKENIQNENVNTEVSDVDDVDSAVVDGVDVSDVDDVDSAVVDGVDVSDVDDVDSDDDNLDEVIENINEGNSDIGADDDSNSESQTDDDKEVWESSDEVPASDNAEIGEDEEDYDEEYESEHKSFTDKFKSYFDLEEYGEEDDGEEESKSKKSSIFSSFSFKKGLKGESKLVDSEELEDLNNEDADSVDLGSEDEYIIVDHGDDEVKTEDINQPENEENTEESINQTSTSESDVDLDSEDVVENQDNDEDIVESVNQTSTSGSDVDLDSEDVVENQDNEEHYHKTVNFSNKTNIESKNDDLEYDEETIIEPEVNDSKVDDNNSKKVEPEPVYDSKVDDNNSKKVEPEPVFEPEIDLGSDDDYIYVDHSNDEVNDIDLDSEDKSINKSEVDSDFKDESVVEPEVDLGRDEDYIYVDHSNDEVRDDDLNNEDKSGDNFDDVFSDEKDEVDDEITVSQESSKENHRSRKKPKIVDSIISEVVNAESQLEPKEIEVVRGEFMDDDETPVSKPAPNDSDVVDAEIIELDDDLNIFNDDLPDLNKNNLPKPSIKEDSHDDEELNVLNDDFSDLNNNEIQKEADNIVKEAVKGFLDDIFDDEELYDEVHKNDDVVEEKVNEHIFDSEVSSEDTVNNISREKSKDSDVTWQQPQREVYQEKSAGENIDFESQKNDIANENNEEVNENHYTNIDNNEQNFSNNESIDSNEEKIDDESMADGVTYYQGAADIHSKLRKNNVYYEENSNKNKSVRDSIKGFKKDMAYINKSLKEIENPTEINYVSVVDRTEEYDPDEYLNRPSDDDSDKILEKENELTFAEKEELRYEKEQKMESLQNEIESDENVIVTVNEEKRREEVKDQALEDIIQTADDDYKQIEKERYQRNNQLKEFDDKKLPGKRKLEDEIVDYVQVADIGLNSADDLYMQPIADVAKSVDEIVEVEGPIHVNEVIRRIKDGCHIKRAGSKLKKVVNSAINEAENSGDIIRIGDFLYDASNNNVLIRKREKPNIDLISDEEIAKNIEMVLLHKSNISPGQIPKETSRNFGFKSTSKKTAERINSVLDLMIANNKVKINNNIVELN